MNFGYARVSSADQNEARQVDALQKAGCDKIVVDKYSGKDFERPGYKKLMRQLKQGDVLFIHSLDRLGRNYQLIKEQWGYLAKKKKVDIVVLDMPLLDTRKDKNLIGAFISDIVLQLLAFVSQMERDNIKKRQAEGIKLAMKRGVKFGHAEAVLPDGFEAVCAKVYAREISMSQAARDLPMCRTTFISKYRIWEAGQELEPIIFRESERWFIPPEGFAEWYEKYKAGDISITELSKAIGKSTLKLRRYMSHWSRQLKAKAQQREEI